MNFSYLKLKHHFQVAESKAHSHNKETAVLKDEIKELTSKLEFLRDRAVSYEKQARMLEQEKNHLQEKFLSECKKSDVAEERYKAAERDAKKGTELADIKDGNSGDYKKFTIAKLKEEHTKHGFGAQLLELRSPNKKDILVLYRKHVLDN